MPLSATPGADDATSYLALAAFAAYAERAGVGAGTYSDAKITRALEQATQRLDLELYVGVPTDAAQALAWPRTGALDPDRALVLVRGEAAPVAITCFPTDVIPRRMRVATAELALQILAGADLRAVDDTRNIKRERVDVLETEYIGAREAADALTRWPSVWRAIAPLVVAAPGDAAAQVTALRPLPTVVPVADVSRYTMLRQLR